MAYMWGKSKISVNDDMDEVPLKNVQLQLQIRQRNDSSDTAKTMTNNVQYGYHQQEMHSITVESVNYPQFLKKALDTPLIVPPRNQWVPLHLKSRFNWKKSLKRSHQENKTSPAQKIKTGWNLPGMEIKRSVTLGFSFNRKTCSVPITLPEPDLESENSSTLTGPSSGLPERLESNLDNIKYSNYYIQNGDSWIFVHRDQNGRLIGQYEINGSCL